MADEERPIQRARLIGPKNYKTVYQKLHYEAAQEREKARQAAEAKAAITPRTVLGVPRPEFGPPTMIRDSDFIDQRPLLTRVRAATSKTVLGAPRPEVDRPSTTKIRSNAFSTFPARLPQPDPDTTFRVTDMAPTMSMIESRTTKLPSGVKFENGYPTYRPDNLQKQVMKDYLAARGKPIDQVDDLKFVQGLDQDASIITRSFYELGKPTAITQGNTVYVNPKKFNEVISFNSDTPFEEAYHSSDFASENGAGFYRPYLLGAIGGLLTDEGYYKGDHYEAFAQGAAKRMYEDYLRRKSKP